MFSFKSSIVVILSALLLFASPVALSEFRADMSAKEVDEIKGTLRVRDLIVNDTARVYGVSLCIRNGNFFLPDSAVLQDEPVDDWGVDLKITVLPGASVKAESVLPITDDMERMRDSIIGLLSYNLQGGTFSESIYCDEIDEVDVAGFPVRYFEVKSIDGLHSLRELYIKLLEDAGL